MEGIALIQQRLNVRLIDFAAITLAIGTKLAPTVRSFVPLKTQPTQRIVDCRF